MLPWLGKKKQGCSMLFSNYVHSVSQSFAAIMFVDDCGTKNPMRTPCLYDSGKIESPFFGGQGNKFGSPTQAKVYGEPGISLKMTATIIFRS
jgi:hypothetical protein